MSIRYIPYNPDPVEGQAVLSNFNRVLRYRGSSDLTGRIERGMPLFTTEKVETVGKEGSGNMLIRGECISACAYLKEKGIEVDLVYIDPPFASGADYAKKIFLRRNPKVAEAIAKAEEEWDIEDFKQFEEKMYGDIWDKEKYLNWMYENLLAIKSVMSNTASIYVHLDWHIGHYVKILLDEVFGEDNFRNEIVWHYQSGGRSDKLYSRKHDTIYWYSKTEEYVFNPDEVGETRGDKKRNNMKRDVDEEGRSYYSIKSNGKEYKYYDDEKIVPDDVWEISHLQQQDPERVNYVTQKPEKLLFRIILGSSKKSSAVADFFGGSGVMAVVANKSGRRFIHCDIGINSIQTTRDRLKANGAEFDILEIKDGVSLYRNPIQTMDKLKSLITGLRDEDNLDKFWGGAISSPTDGLVPVYVPNLMDGSIRVFDEALMNRIIYEAIPDLDKDVEKVIIYYIDVEDFDKIKDTVKNSKDLHIKIEFRDLKEILDDVVLEDNMSFSIEKDRSKVTDGFVVKIDKFVSDTVFSKIRAFNLKSSQNDKKGIFTPITISEEGLETIEMISLDCTAKEGIWHPDYEIKIDNESHLIINGKKTKEYWDGTVRSEKMPLRIKTRNICGDETIFEV